MTGHRRKPFSGKAKKAQLQARKARKAARQGTCDQQQRAFQGVPLLIQSQLDRAEQEPHPVNQEEQQHHESNITQSFVPAREAAPTFDSKHTGSSRK